MDWLYTLFLTLHNILRWVTLVLAIMATVMAFAGWFGKREWGERDRKIGSFTAMAMDIQFLLGLILYVVLSPFGIKGLSQGMEFVSANRDFRFFGLEHFAAHAIGSGVCSPRHHIAPKGIYFIGKVPAGCYPIRNYVYSSGRCYTLVEAAAAHFFDIHSVKIAALK